MNTRLIAAAVAIALITVPAAAQDDTARLTEKGRTLTQQFYTGEYEAIAAEFDDQMKTAIGGAEGLGAFHAQLQEQLGSETEVLSERVTTADAHRIYERSVKFEKFPGTIAITWVFDSEEKVSGFQVRPGQQAAASRFLDYETKADLRLPFTEEWTVVWGGRTIEQNYHAANAGQRFAYDILIVRDSSTHTGTGESNSDYYCFGNPIVAPGAGTVVSSRDGIADNVPGEMEATEVTGNSVVIDHGNEEYSFLAHMQNGSVRVKEGDVVAPGDTLGLCGNSGRSSEPHLHYHMQNSALLNDGEGLPAQFQGYYANDELVQRGEPVQGQRIRPSGR